MTVPDLRTSRTQTWGCVLLLRNSILMRDLASISLRYIVAVRGFKAIEIGETHPGSVAAENYWGVTCALLKLDRR